MSRTLLVGCWLLLVVGIQLSADVSIRQPVSVRPLRICARDPLHGDVSQVAPANAPGANTAWRYRRLELRELPIAAWHHSSENLQRLDGPPTQSSSDVVEIEEGEDETNSGSPTSAPEEARSPHHPEFAVPLDRSFSLPGRSMPACPSSACTE